MHSVNPPTISDWAGWWTPGPDNLDRIHTLQQIATSQGNWQYTGIWLMMGDVSTFWYITGRTICPSNASSCMDQIHDHHLPLSNPITVHHELQSDKSTIHPQVALPQTFGLKMEALLEAETNEGSNDPSMDLLGTGTNGGTNIPPMDHPMDMTDETELPQINPEDAPLYDDPPSM
ncbi:hypothetical protein BDQ17DRAFT_1329540 [Cyathus striatus]|nr:hypothetical protein BDQ17DRAFT_1329540 [Cyathus striatus]